MFRNLNQRTDIASALEAACNDVWTAADDRPNAPNIMIFVSDGDHNIRVLDTCKCIKVYWLCSRDIIQFKVRLLYPFLCSFVHFWCSIA